MTFGAASVVIAPFIDTFIASLSARRQPHRALLCRPHQPIAAGRAGHRAGHGAAAGNVGAAGAGATRRVATRRRTARRRMSLLLTLPFAAAFLAIPGTIMRGCLRPWRFQHRRGGRWRRRRWRPMARACPPWRWCGSCSPPSMPGTTPLTPVRATVTAMVCNIALKLVFVWGLHLGVAGVALGTALGAWINVGAADLAGPQPRPAGDRDSISCARCRRSLLAALAAGAGAWIGARLAAPLLQGAFGDVAGAGGGDALRRGSPMARWCCCSAARLPLGTAGAMRLFVALALPDAVAQSPDADPGRGAGRALADARAVASDPALHRRSGWPRRRHAGRCAGRDSTRRPSICSFMASASSATSSRMRCGRRRARTSCWSICSARWTPPSAASASRRTRTNSCPHVTLARLRHPEAGKVLEWLTHHALYTSAEFPVGAFRLYSSKLTSDGSIYRVEQDYPLEDYR